MGNSILFVLFYIAVLASSASADSTTLIHNSQNTGSSRWAAEGGWGVPGGKYGEFTCITCHGAGSSNIKNIRETISTPDGQPWNSTGTPDASVAFRSTHLAPDNMGDDTGGHANSTKVCEVCHSVTNFHRYNTAGQAVLDHNNGVDCMECHSHSKGFKPSCTVCHGFPPISPETLVFSPTPTGSATPGAHNFHVNVKGVTCNSCHNGSVGTGATHNNGRIVTLGFSVAGGAKRGGAYDGQTTALYNTSEANTTVTNTGTKTCTNIYCHSNAEPRGKANAFRSPAWDGPSMNCGSCHDTGGALTSLSGRHAKHTNAGTYAFPCEKCHSATVTGSSAIKNQAMHANASKDIVFAAGGSFNSTDASCASTACHSDGKGGSPNTPAAWLNAETQGHAPCDLCHNGRPGSETNVMSTGGHDRLVGTGWVRRFPCRYCHAATVNSSNEIGDYTKHVNQTVDVAIASDWNIVGKPAPSYDAATKTCDNVYCHSDGTTVNPQVRPFAWTSGRTHCNTCHGHEQGSCSQCHADGRTAWAAGDEWKSAMPMYTSTGAGTERANSHVRHLMTNFPCDKCHNATIINGSCTDCHVNGRPSGSMSEVSHINPAYHVNRTKDVVLSDGGTYNPLTKRCSNTVCHTGGDPQWGDTVNGEVICLSCHGTTGADVDDFAYGNGTRAKINMTQWETTGHGRPASAGAYPKSGNPAAAFPGNPCWYCHDNGVLHGTASNPFRLKIHQQFEKRFDKECVFCHMERTDAECMGCHNSSFSMAPQLANLASPPLSQDHTGYADGQTSCVAVCHSTNAAIHKTTMDIAWTAQKKADVRNSYKMMGVCLQCHEDERNGQCEKCHTGPQYRLGYDPGTGYIKATTARATSVHFGYKHYAGYESTGVWKGGKFCWDCHDPHGDNNIYMIQDRVSTATDGSYGVPTAQSDVLFTRKSIGTDYAKSSAPYTGICNVCHTAPGQHYKSDYGDSHNEGRVCTTCHEHRWSDSHGSGKSCNTCHADRPVPRHTAFGLPRDCTKCHNGAINMRMDIMGQFGIGTNFQGNSHHVQGGKVTNKHCYACHWEATELGLINTAYHSGYNYKEHTSTSGGPVNLVVWGPGARPATYQDGSTAVTFTASKVGTVDERAEVSKVTQVCLGCHSDQNKNTKPFEIVDPDNPDCQTPAQYAWDRTSVAARYSQTGTASWGKYSSSANPRVTKKDTVTKAFSAHGNATANQGGWSATTGYEGTIPNTRNGSQAVQCYDCHSSHGSKATGVTSSYATYNGTFNGANLKETQAGKGGYAMTYKPAANTDTSGVNPFASGAALCFDCHETQTSGTKPWGYQSTFGATSPIMGYKDTSRFGQGTKGSTARFAYRANKATIMGGHFKASSTLGNSAMQQINGLCTPCHDPHGVSPTLGANQAYALPMLKGTWLTTPYQDDRTQPTASGQISQSNLTWRTDRSTFGNPVVISDNTKRINETEDQFAGLCLRCHPKANLTTDVSQAATSTLAWKSRERIHRSVKGWGWNTGDAEREHAFPCSKCHQPHNSGLPRLMQTNCLDSNHRGNVASGGTPSGGGSYCNPRSRGGYPMGMNPAGSGSSNPPNLDCHGSDPGTGGWPGDVRWNNVTPW